MVSQNIPSVTTWVESKANLPALTCHQLEQETKKLKNENDDLAKENTKLLAENIHLKAVETLRDFWKWMN